MFIEEEKRVIYKLMKEIIEERRELSKQYFDLKQRLNELTKKEESVPRTYKKNFSILERERITQQDYLKSQNKNSYYNSFDRVSKNIISILKNSTVPLSNKQILAKLNKEYELSISLRNLTCNILPKMNKERSLPIQKAYRGYWQYKLFIKEGSHRR